MPNFSKSIHSTGAFFASLIFIPYHVSSFASFRPFSRPLPKRGHLQNCKSLPELEMSDGRTSTSSPFVIALTREEGKNGKLRKALLSNERIQKLEEKLGMPVQVNEIPCIEHAVGPDSDRLAPTLSSSTFDYVAVTSPEAAKVLASAWADAGKPQLGMVAAVGKATQESLNKFGIEVAFVPSKATADTLVKELPPADAAISEGRPTSLLYPASAKAANTLQNGLEERGFAALRLNTYDTVPASWNTEQISLAKSTTIACFASPSAVKAWLGNTSAFQMQRVLAACIGETSANACKQNEWDQSAIFYPQKPGVVGWAEAVADALEFSISSQ